MPRRMIAGAVDALVPSEPESPAKTRQEDG